MIKKEGWVIKNLGELSEVITKGTTPTSIGYNFTNVGVNFIKLESLTPTGDIIPHKVAYISEECHKALKRSQLKVNDILFSIAGALGRIGIVKEEIIPANTNQALAIIRLKENTGISIDFLAKYLISDFISNEIEKLKGGVAQQNLSLGQLNNLIVPIPPLSTQHQIVSELDALSKIITKKKQQLEELDKLAQATFYDMFGDPVNNEKGLTVKSLGDICEITSSKRIYAEEYQQEGIPFYRSKEIIEKGKRKPISLELFISNERYNEIKNKFGIPEIGDILMTAVGTIGEIWVVDSNAPFYFKDGNIVWLKMNNSNNSTYFLFVLGLLVKEYKTKMAVGAAYSALTIVNLKNMKVVYPVLEVQNQFAIKIESIEKQKELINKSIDDVQQLFDYTMDKYFN